MTTLLMQMAAMISIPLYTVIVLQTLSVPQPLQTLPSLPESCISTGTFFTFITTIAHITSITTITHNLYYHCYLVTCTTSLLQLPSLPVLLQITTVTQYATYSAVHEFNTKPIFVGCWCMLRIGTYYNQNDVQRLLINFIPTTSSYMTVM